MSDVHIYGIKNCDSCRRARRWLDEAGVAYQWIDLRTDGIDRARLEIWKDVLGADVLLNKRSKTWRDFDARQRAAAQADPVAVLVGHPTLIKRPVLEATTTTLAGFSEARYETAVTGTLS
ncbi:MAG: Spx/MgsR family RNA polymerase-binding regulatory protein [Salinisphaera sp.]|jgi:arsenate reductase|nr:Spx/MgsR family RNA polymerase-binding regulatory protein [Salinisphaera sp.]